MSPNSLQSYRKMLEINYGVRLPGRTKSVIWSVAIVIVTALTIREFVPLISEYKKNNIATQVQVILLDEQFRPPQMVLSLPRQKYRNVYGDNLMILAVSLYENNGTCGLEAQEICENLTTASWDVWSGRVKNFRRTTLNAFYGDLVLAFVEKIFVNPIGEDIFDDQFSSWNEPVISAFLNYVGSLAWSDYNLSPQPPIEFFQFYQFPFADFQTKIQNYDSKLELLYNRALNFLCSRMNYTELDYLHQYSQPSTVDGNCSDLLPNSRSPVYVGVGLTFALPPVVVPTIKEYRFAITKHEQSSRNSSLLAKVGTDPLTTTHLYADVGTLYASSFDEIYTQFIFQSPVEKGKAGGSKIRVEYKVQMRAREARPTENSCLNGTSVTTCFAQCTKLWVIEKCQCVPFSIKKGLVYPHMESTPYCSPVSYAKCNITGLPKTVSDDCMGKCKRPCDHTIYLWQINHDSFETREANLNEFIIKMVPQFDTFTEFTWILKDTPEQFFSQLAGVGSFYLNVSALSVVSVIFWCLDLWKRVKKHQADRKGQGDTDMGAIKQTAIDIDGYGRSGQQWAETESKLQARWLEDIVDILEKYGIKKPGTSD